MTDKELSAFGEKLYEAILTTPLPAGMVFAIATCLRQGVPWARLPPPLKLAIFKIAATCATPEGPPSPGAAENPEPVKYPSPAGMDAPVETEPRGAVPSSEMTEERLAPSADIDGVANAQLTTEESTDGDR